MLLPMKRPYAIRRAFSQSPAQSRPAGYLYDREREQEAEQGSLKLQRFPGGR